MRAMCCFGGCSVRTGSLRLGFVLRRLDGGRGEHDEVNVVSVYGASFGLRFVNGRKER